MSSEMVKKLEAAVNDETKQAEFYEHFLNTNVYIPTWNKPEEQNAEAANQNEGVQIQPVIMEDEGTNYIILFDTEERLNAWAQSDIHFVAMQGAMVLETFRSQFHLILNLGQESNKIFKPEEIEWLLKHISPAGQA